MNERTAYLVAHAYTDPNGKMLPQIHAVRIYSESATSLSICPRDTAALNVYEARGNDYQSASDMLCYVVQTMRHFAWCRPLMSAEHMEPIDYLHLEFGEAHATPSLHDVLCDVLRCSAADARRYIQDGAGPLVRQRALDEINTRQRTARAWHKRAFDAQKCGEFNDFARDALPDAVAEIEQIETEVLALYLRVDCQLLDGNFAAVAYDMAATDVSTTPIILLLAWLTSTLPAKEHLPARASFAQAVQTRLEREDPMRAESLLRGLL